MINATIFQNAFPIIAKLAPTFARAIGGFPGIAMTYVLPLLAHAAGTNSTDIPTMISNFINDPKAQNNLKDLEHDHADWLCSLLESTNRITQAEINIKLSWANPQS
jgi:hypothetical protein